MSRDEEFQEYDDGPARKRPRRANVVSVTTPGRPQRPKSSGNRWVGYVLLGLLGLGVLGFAGLVVAVQVARDANPEWAAEMDKQAEFDRQYHAAEAKKKEAHTKVYTRREFDSLVIGRDEAAVLKAVGKPERTQELGQFTYWYYSRRTKDTITDNIDWSAQVAFEFGRVKSVNY